MKCTMILTGIVLVWESSNNKGENMKHFAIKDEVYEKVIFPPGPEGCKSKYRILGGKGM